MKPRRNHKEFWLGNYPFLDIDIFQPREALFGFTFASAFAMEPKEVKRCLEKKVDDSQWSIFE